MTSHATHQHLHNVNTHFNCAMLDIIRNYSRNPTMKVDSAVSKLLRLDADTTSVSSAGGGGCSSASTSKIVSKLKDGTEKTFFMKTGSGSAAEVMFEGQ
jgi:hypothetical protein